MTKKDFIHKAVLSMLANPVTADESTNNVITDAENMAKSLEAKGYQFEDGFDEPIESVKTFISNISEFLMDIRDAIQAPNGGELSTFQEIAATLHEKFSPVTFK